MHSLPNWKIHLPFEIHTISQETNNGDGVKELIDVGTTILTKLTNGMGETNDFMEPEKFIDDKELSKLIGEVDCNNPSLLMRCLNRIRRLLFMDLFLWARFYWLFCFRLPYRMIYFFIGYLMVIRIPFVKK